MAKKQMTLGAAAKLTTPKDSTKTGKITKTIVVPAPKKESEAAREKRLAAEMMKNAIWGKTTTKIGNKRPTVENIKGVKMKK